MDKPEIAQIEVSTRCQLSCLMCPKSVYKCEWISKDMRMDTFKLIPFKKFKYIHLQGWGEPLLNRNIGQMIEVAKKHCKVGLTTNGLLIKEYIDDLLKTDLVAISVASADGNLHEKIRKCKLEKIAEGIRLLSELRHKRPKITITTMMLKSTIETLPSIIDFAAECGVDEVIANNLDYIPSKDLVGMEIFEVNSKPSAEKFIRMAEKKAEEKGVEFIHRPLLMEEALVCAENPTKTCLVTVDGLIAPCVYLHLPTTSKFIRRYFGGKKVEVPKTYFGHVSEFDKAWKSKKYRGFREVFKRRLSIIHEFLPLEYPTLPEVCRTCFKAYSI